MHELSTAFVKRVRDPRELRAQAATLRAFGSHRAVAVIDVRLDRGELVLERLTPGAPLASHATEDEAMQAIARLLADGWPQPPLPTDAEPLDTFARALDARRPPFSRAAALFRELTADHVGAALLHGDLHYGNVLSSDRARDRYLLIDPKGAIGEPAFDAGYLVSRPAVVAGDAMTLCRAIDRRLEFFPDAVGLDRRRVAAYAYVAAALSLAWALEDGDGSRDAFEESMVLLEART
jgi:streptomycin 6-kinase